MKYGEKSVKASILSNPAGLLAIFYYYIGSLSFSSYLYAFIKARLVLPILDWFILISIGLLFCLSLYISGIFESFQLFRFHWGFLIFYILFRGNTQLYSMKSLLILLLTLVVLEGVLVNSVISAEILPNYPQDRESAQTHFSDIWQRAYSFGGNASVTGVLLVAILSIIHPSTLLLVGTFIALLFTGSGSGGVAYICYLIYKASFRNKITVLVIVGGLFFVATSLIPVLYKISPEYMSILLELKQSQAIQAISSMNYTEILIGTSNPLDMGGDFLWLSFFVCHGILGGILLVLFVAGRINRTNAFGILIILAMTLHYQVLFSLPGQLIVGYLFALKGSTLHRNCSRLA